MEKVDREEMEGAPVPHRLLYEIVGHVEDIAGQIEPHSKLLAKIDSAASKVSYPLWLILMLLLLHVIRHW